MTGERTALSSAQREPPYGLYTGARALAFNTRLSCSPTVCRAAQGAQAHARLGSSHGRSSSDAGREGQLALGSAVQQITGGFTSRDGATEE